jgi:hypothetical protein
VSTAGKRAAELLVSSLADELLVSSLSDEGHRVSPTSAAASYCWCRASWLLGQRRWEEGEVHWYLIAF